MANSNYTTTVLISEERRGGGYWILWSDDLPGFMMSGTDLKQLRGEAPDLLKAFFRLNYDMDVEVRRWVDPAALRKHIPQQYLSDTPNKWTTIPQDRRQEVH